MSKKQLWETRPLECWGKAKALRAKWQKSIDEAAAAPNSLLAHGNTGNVDWSAGFSALNLIEDNPVGAMMASMSDGFSRECRLAGEVRGWGREICGYCQNCWGSQFLGRQLDGSPFPLRQLSIPFPDPCDQHTKRGQQAMDLSPIPRWGADFPLYPGPRDPEREKALTVHRTGCTLRVINDVERIFGQKYTDENLYDAIRTLPLLEELSLDISKAMTSIPSPLSQKDLYSFYTLGMLTRGDPQETLDFWKELRDEVVWRAQNQIAAVANERYRWMEAHPSPWHFLKYYRYMEQYGAVCIGSQYSHMISGAMELKEDGSLGQRSTHIPMRQEVTSREDALMSVYHDARSPHLFKIDEYTRPYALCEFAKAFKVDGAIMPLWRGGVGCTLTRKEQGIRLNEIGVRVLHYEGSQPGDRTDLDENRFIDQLDTWMESQGLRKLED